jgi:hypothetical protein
MTALLLFLCIWTAILGGVQAQPGERCLCGIQLMHCDALAATTDCSSRLQQAHEPHHQLVQLTMAASLGQKQVADDNIISINQIICIPARHPLCCNAKARCSALLT